MTLLRYAIFVDDDRLPAWQLDCIERLREQGRAELVLIVVNDTKARQRKRSLYSLYNRHRLQKRIRMARLKDLPTHYDDVPRLRATVARKGKFSEYFSKADIERMREAQLDFAIRFGFGIIRGRVLNVPRYGVWSYHHGDMNRYRGAPSCFWELYEGERVVGVTLQRLTEKLDAGVALFQGWYRVRPYSLSQTRDIAYASGAGFVAKVVADVCAGQADYLEAPPLPTDAMVRTIPSSLQFIQFATRLSVAKVREKIDWLFRHEQWGVGIVKQPVQAFLDQEQAPVAQWLTNPSRNVFMADPAATVEADGVGIFVEELDYRVEKGRIVYIKLSDEGELSAPKPVMDFPVHLSYPFMVEHDGKHYCVPEMAEGNEVALYAADAYPGEWRKVATLLADTPGLDPTLFQHESRWWMFCAMRVASGAYSLVAYYADEITGPWLPHARNPLTADIRTSRPGGAVFVHDGELYRPAQDCSRTYGGALSIMRILKLTPTEFAEELVRTVEPNAKDQYVDGFHTVYPVCTPSGEALTLIDGKRRIFIPALFRRALGF